MHKFMHKIMNIQENMYKSTKNIQINEKIFRKTLAFFNALSYNSIVPDEGPETLTVHLNKKLYMEEEIK